MIAMFSINVLTNLHKSTKTCRGTEKRNTFKQKPQPNGGENRNFITGKRRTGYMEQNCQNQQTFR